MPYNRDDRQVSQGGEASSALRNLFGPNPKKGVARRPANNRSNTSGRNPRTGGYAPGYRPGSYQPGAAKKPDNIMGAIESIFGKAQDIAGGLQASGPQTFGRSLSDYLAEAGDGSNLISSQLAALEAQRAAGRAQQQRGDSDIANMYAALQQSLRGDQASAAARYAAANKESIASSDAANQAIQQALTNAQSSQAETLANLGISDAGKQAAQTQGDYSTMNTAATATNADAARQALTRQGQAQQDLYGAWGTAAGFRGNERRADLQNELASFLSDRAGEEAQLRDQAAQSARQQAMQQYTADQDAFYRNQEYLQGLDDRAYSRGMDRYNLDLQQQQLQAEADEASRPDLSVDNKGGLQNAMNYISSIGFRDPATGSRILREVRNAAGGQGYDIPKGQSKPTLSQMLAYLETVFGRGNGTQLDAAQNALMALLGSSGINK